jgi:hypothetical protein
MTSEQIKNLRFGDRVLDKEPIFGDSIGTVVNCSDLHNVHIVFDIKDEEPILNEGETLYPINDWTNEELYEYIEGCDLEISSYSREELLKMVNLQFIEEDKRILGGYGLYCLVEDCTDFRDNDLLYFIKHEDSVDILNKWHEWNEKYYPKNNQISKD